MKSPPERDRNLELRTLPSRGTISQNLADRIAAEKTFKKRLVAITCNDRAHARLVYGYVERWNGSEQAQIHPKQPIVYARVDSPILFDLLYDEKVDIREDRRKKNDRITSEFDDFDGRPYFMGAKGTFWL